ncbi:MAG: hypothetical protein ACRCV6_10485 [Formosimonas sp.]
MALAWLTAALAALPHITDLVKTSKELLKNRKPSEPVDLSHIDDPLARVSAACEHNTESIRLLTEQMHSQLQHFQTNATALQKRLRRMTIVSFLIALAALLKTLSP